MRQVITVVLLATLLLTPTMSYAASHGGHGGGGGGGHKSAPVNDLWYPFATLGGLVALVLYTTKRPKE